MSRPAEVVSNRRSVIEKYFKECKFISTGYKCILSDSALALPVVPQSCHQVTSCWDIGYFCLPCRIRSHRIKYFSRKTSVPNLAATVQHPTTKIRLLESLNLKCSVVSPMLWSIAPTFPFSWLISPTDRACVPPDHEAQWCMHAVCLDHRLAWLSSCNHARNPV